MPLPHTTLSFFVLPISISLDAGNRPKPALRLVFFLFKPIINAEDSFLFFEFSDSFRVRYRVRIQIYVKPKTWNRSPYDLRFTCYSNELFFFLQHSPTKHDGGLYTQWDGLPSEVELY